MKRVINTKFWYVDQNNVFGRTICNSSVGDYVWIEAFDLTHFKARASKIFESTQDECECCGIRWDYEIISDEDGSEIPREITSIYCSRKRKNLVHLIDGSVIDINDFEK